MGQLMGAVITAVSKKKTGDGNYGPWTLYNFQTDQSDDWYSYFQSGDKPVPLVGMKIAFAEYTEEQNGRYTNLVIDKLAVAEERVPPPQAKSNTQQRTRGQQPSPPGSYKDQSILISYAKDLLVAKIASDREFAKTPIKDLMKGCVTVGLHAHASLGNPQHDWGSKLGNNTLPSQNDPWLTEMKEWRKKFETTGHLSTFYQILEAVAKCSHEANVAPDLRNDLLDEIKATYAKLDDIPF
jgi:hypothetical protein